MARLGSMKELTFFSDQPRFGEVVAQRIADVGLMHGEPAVDGPVRRLRDATKAHLRKDSQQVVGRIELSRGKAKRLPLTLRQGLSAAGRIHVAEPVHPHVEFVDDGGRKDRRVTDHFLPGPERVPSVESVPIRRRAGGGAVTVARLIRKNE